jgi:predicted DNA-binding transcriptional regulator AlpA
MGRTNHTPAGGNFDPDAMLAARQVAALLAVSVRTVWRYTRGGAPGFPAAVRVGPKVTRFRRRRKKDVRFVVGFRIFCSGAL